MRDFALLIHFLGLVMGLGASVAFLFLGKAASGMAPDDARNFMLNVSVLGRMGLLGLLLLLLSGLYLMGPYWNTLSASPLLAAKLGLFLLLAALVGVLNVAISRARAGAPGKMRTARRIGPAVLVTGLVVLVLAVLNFH
jgi:hypothetical protein